MVVPPFNESLSAESGAKRHRANWYLLYRKAMEIHGSVRVRLNFKEEREGN
jgi:hypothetical protein